MPKLGALVEMSVLDDQSNGPALFFEIPPSALFVGMTL